jgi:prepilin-type N-terminal cleavage/methylation domain-containing protein
MSSLAVLPGAHRACGPDSPRRSGFTIIELLVAVSLITILMATALPAVQQAREAARRTQCQNHLRQLGLAVHQYHELHSTLPPGSIVLSPLEPLATGWGWGALILPQLDQSPLHDRIDFRRPNASADNSPLLAQTLPVFRCASDAAPLHIEVGVPGTGVLPVAHGNYSGSAAVLHECSRTRLTDIRDGTSQTLLIGERRYLSTLNGDVTSSWCGTITSDIEYLPYQSLPHVRVFPGDGINDNDRFNSRHPGGVHFLVADGSVQLLSDSLDRSVYYALSTPAGSESVSLPF